MLWRLEHLYSHRVPLRPTCSMAPSDGRFLRRYLCASFAGVVVVALAVRMHSAGTPPPEFELGSAVSVVSIRSAASGKYLAVSLEDGLVRATAATSAPLEARFRVHVLSAPTVLALRKASALLTATSTLAAAASPTVTVSGCTCSGFSNEHGFGRYCFPWETDVQQPWYVRKQAVGGRLWPLWPLASEL